MRFLGCTFMSGEIGDAPGTEYKPFDNVGISKVSAKGKVLDREVIYTVFFDEPFKYPNYTVDLVSFEKEPFLRKEGGLTPKYDVTVDTQFPDRVVLKAKQGLHRVFTVRVVG